MSFVDLFPSLNDWYHAQSTPPTPISDRLLYDLCTAMNGSSSEMTPIWCKGLDRFLTMSADPFQDFCKTEELASELGLDVFDTMACIARQALHDPNCGKFYQHTVELADATQLVSIRFLTAWISLNAGDLEGCIDICENVEKPYAAIYTIHGQALLETGQAHDAEETLKIATELSPSEILAWFQLAKAQLCLGRHQDAFASLKRCLQLSPNNEEVLLFQMMILKDMPDDDINRSSPELWRDIEPSMDVFLNSADAVSSLLLLSAKENSPERFQKVIDNANWPRFRNEGRAALLKENIVQAPPQPQPRKAASAVPSNFEISLSLYLRRHFYFGRPK